MANSFITNIAAYTVYTKHELIESVDVMHCLVDGHSTLKCDFSVYKFQP